jgi:RNA polymerase sigma-70 factor, ECF subfamily
MAAARYVKMIAPQGGDAVMDLTADLQLARQGDAPAAERLMPAVYDELRRLAAHYLRDEGRAHTLQPTALVHEAYLRLVDQTRARVHDHNHFVAVAATAMRRILVDHARRKNAAKRNEGARDPRVDVATSEPDFVAIDDALERLAARSERQARVVELRYFCGLTIEEAASVLGVSAGTVKQDWSAACAYLRRDWERAEHPR